MVDAKPGTYTAQIAEQLNVDHATATEENQIGEKLDKWVSHELTEREQSSRLDLYSSLFLQKNCSFMECIVRDDEKQIIYGNRRYCSGHRDAKKHLTFQTSASSTAEL